MDEVEMEEFSMMGADVYALQHKVNDLEDRIQKLEAIVSRLDSRTSGMQMIGMHL